ncbi:hypothetical protein AAG906_033101 [Vitis piasezkii]
MDFESKDPELRPASILTPIFFQNEVIKPTINGVLSIIKSCAKAGSVWRLVFTSSAGTVNVEEQRRPEYDESCWSDLDKRCPDGEASMENNLEFVSIIPTLVVDPFITPTMPPSLITALSPLTGNEAHYSIVNSEAMPIHFR